MFYSAGKLLLRLVVEESDVDADDDDDDNEDSGTSSSAAIWDSRRWIPMLRLLHKNIAFDSYYIFPKTLTERSFMIFFICVLKKRLVTFMCGLHLLSLYNSGF